MNRYWVHVILTLVLSASVLVLGWVRHRAAAPRALERA